MELDGIFKKLVGSLFSPPTQRSSVDESESVVMRLTTEEILLADYLVSIATSVNISSRVSFFAAAILGGLAEQAPVRGLTSPLPPNEIFVACECAIGQLG